MTYATKSDKSRNGLLRNLIMSVMRKAGHPVNIQYIVTEVEKLGFKAREHLSYKVSTNLGVLRTEGKIRKGSFPTGNHIDYGYRIDPETKTFWYLADLTVAQVVAAKSAFKARWQEKYPNVTINAGPPASQVPGAKQALDRRRKRGNLDAS